MSVSLSSSRRKTSLWISCSSARVSRGKRVDSEILKNSSKSGNYQDCSIIRITNQAEIPKIIWLFLYYCCFNYIALVVVSFSVIEDMFCNFIYVSDTLNWQTNIVYSLVAVKPIPVPKKIAEIFKNILSESQKRRKPWNSACSWVLMAPKPLQSLRRW